MDMAGPLNTHHIYFSDFFSLTHTHFSFLYDSPFLFVNEFLIYVYLHSSKNEQICSIFIKGNSPKILSLLRPALNCLK